MAIQVRAVATTASGASPRTVDKPAGTAEGDLLVMQVSSGSAVAPNSLPSGFALVTDAELATVSTVRVYTKVAGASEPASYEVGFPSGAGHTVGLMAIYSDTAATLMPDGVATQENVAADRIFPSVTTTIAGALFCGFAALGNIGSIPPGGSDERWDTGASPRIYLLTETIAGTGPTGTRTATGIDANNNAVTVAFAEQSAALDTPTALTATPVATDQIDLVWEDTNADETGFEVERSADGISGWAQIGTTLADDFTYSDTGLDPGTTYYYRVRAYKT